MIVLLAFIAFATFVAWKLVRNTNLRRELRSQRDLLRTAFADISHQTVQHCKYAALMAKVQSFLLLLHTETCSVLRLIHISVLPPDAIKVLQVPHGKSIRRDKAGCAGTRKSGYSWNGNIQIENWAYSSPLANSGPCFSELQGKA